MSIGGLISGIFGSENEDKPVVQKQAYNVDPNAYQYGGHAGGADAAAGAATAQGQTNNAAQGSYQNQQNNLYNTGLNQLGAGNAQLNQGQYARDAQVDAMNMAKNRAQGNDLISNRVAGQQSQQLAAQQASAAASARGPAALAMAQQNAASNTATGQSNIAANAGINAAQEQLANQNAYAGQASGIRGQDIGSAQTAFGSAGTAFGAGAQSGQLGVQSGQLGLGYAGLANNIQQSQMAGQMNQQAQTSANIAGAQNTAAAVGGQNAQTNQRNGEGLLNMIGGAGSGAAGLFLAKGGPARGGHEYLVGEQGTELVASGGHPFLVGQHGPEMLSPKKDGFVFTAPQTEMLLRTMTPEQKRALGGHITGCTRAGGGEVLAPGGTMTRGPEGLGPGDPNAPRMSYAPNVGWYDPTAQPGPSSAESAAFDKALGARVDEDQMNADLDAKVANQARLDGNAEEAKKIRGDFAKDNAAKKPATQGKPDDKKGGGIFTPFSSTMQVDGVHPGGYTPPSMIGLPARAQGGLIQGLGGPPGGDALGGMVLAPSGGMDVMGSLKKTSDMETSGGHGVGGWARETGGSVLGNKIMDAAGDAADATKKAALNVGDFNATLWHRSPAGQAIHSVGDFLFDPGHAPMKPMPRDPEPIVRPHEITEPVRTETPAGYDKPKDGEARARGGIVLAKGGKKRRAA